MPDETPTAAESETMATLEAVCRHVCDSGCETCDDGLYFEGDEWTPCPECVMGDRQRRLTGLADGIRRAISDLEDADEPCETIIRHLEDALREADPSGEASDTDADPLTELAAARAKIRRIQDGITKTCEKFVQSHGVGPESDFIVSRLLPLAERGEFLRRDTDDDD